METAVNRIGALCIAGVLSVWAQDGPRGHWSGSVEVPNQTLAMEVDLDKGPNGWIGSISIPAQNASGIPLDAIAFTNGKCAFRVKGAPGDPTFTGTLSADGKTMTGDFTQGPGAFPFKFSRTGDPSEGQSGGGNRLPWNLGRHARGSRVTAGVEDVKRCKWSQGRPDIP